MQPNKQYDVIAVGNAIVDILARVEDSFLEKHGIPRAGMMLVDEEKAASIYNDMGSSGATVECSGGSAANTLAALAALGAETAFIGKTKDDHLGNVFRHDIQNIGVDFNTAPAEDGPETGRCIISVTPDGERSMSTYLGVCANVYEEDIDLDNITNTRVFYVEGYLWDQPHAKQAINKAIQACAKSGVKVAMTLSDVFCVERHRMELKMLAKFGVDILFGNEVEMFSLFETDDIEKVVKELKDIGKLAVITRGPKGATVVTPLGESNVETAAIDRVIDTTGAGDLFAAGFLYGYANDWEYERSAALGNHCAGHIIQQMGARSQTPLLNFLYPI